MKRHLSLALILSLLLSCLLLSVPTHGATALEGGTNLLLHIGSPIALSNGKILPLDPNNPGLAPFIHKSRTLVPLRMIAEHFGADVDYDEAARTALIDVEGKKAAFPIGKNYFSLDGKRIDLDTETLLVSGRTFVPLRVICEQILGLQVDYQDSVIYIAKQAKLTDKIVSATKEKIGMFLKTTSLSALKAAFSNKGYPNSQSMSFSGTVPEEAAPAPTQAPSRPATDSENAAADTARGSSDYSSTNIQVEGIDEGDIVKTDGTYIYTIAGNQFKIVRAAGLSLVSSVKMEDTLYAREMYIDKDRVIVIGERNYYSDIEPYAVSVDHALWGKSFTIVAVYDTSDKAHPKLDRSFEIQGSITATRKKGDYIYLVTSYHIGYWGDIDPRPLLVENGKPAPLPVSDIMIAQDSRNDSILTVSAVNFRDAKEPVSEESITGSGYVTYMSNNAFYIAMPDYWNYDRETLNIARFSIDGAKIGYSGSATVEGSVNDQFSMDEYEGHLRLATSIWWPQTQNNLYVLDENMDVCGSITGFAPGERIYSARFMGARGYIVTFRQVDPLFVFDLSDPKAPKKVGELKVPGFSNYLHPVSENILLGVGRDVYDLYRRDASGKEVVIGQQTGGLKLSLFDVSDAGLPKEISTLVLGDYGWSEFLYNHKAVMFKNDESLLAFPASISWAADGKNAFAGALLISWKNNKLSERGRIPNADNAGDYYYGGDRLVYIGNTLYFLQGGQLRSFDLATLKPLGSLNLAK